MGSNLVQRAVAGEDWRADSARESALRRAQGVLVNVENSEFRMAEEVDLTLD